VGWSGARSAREALRAPEAARVSVRERPTARRVCLVSPAMDNTHSGVLASDRLHEMGTNPPSGSSVILAGGWEP